MLEFGFPLDVQGVVPVCTELRNHKGARDHPAQVKLYLDQEAARGRLAGPFSSNPLSTPLHISPLNTVPKDDTERRIITDLSWPIGSSVNDHISKTTYLGEEVALHYVTVEEICAMVRCVGTNALIYKCDLKKAYRQIPVDPGDYRFLGYFWEDSLFIDTVLAMGQRNAAMACQRSTDGVMFIHRQRGHDGKPYLDDLIGVSPPSTAADGFEQLGTLLCDLGLEENVPKAYPPASSQVVLGIVIDCPSMTISVPRSRMDEIYASLKDWMVKIDCTKTELQSFIGVLCFVVKCVWQSRVFVNRMLCLLRSFTGSQRSITLSADFKKDVLWWVRFMDTFNGVSFIPDSKWYAPDLIFATDSTLTGCGGLTDTKFFHARFPDHILQLVLDINALEILGVLVAVRLWGAEYAGRRILVYCDNMQAVHAINSGKTRSEFMGKCVRQLWLEIARFHFHLRAVHLPGVENRLADSLSRWDLSPIYQESFWDQTRGRVFTECLISDDLFLLFDEF